MTLLNTINVGGTDFGLLNSTAIGACSTPAGNEVKECTFADSFELQAGVVVTVTFTYANTYGNGSTTYPKLSVNGTSYPIKYATNAYAGAGAWVNGQTVPFMFDGTGFILVANLMQTSVISSANTTVNGAPLYNGANIKVMFTSALAGTDTSTALVLNYNGSNIAVKVPVNGALADYTAKAVDESGTTAYYFCQAYTTLELLFDGTYFVITNNPVVISNSDYTIYADGLKRVDSVNSNDKNMVTSNAVYKSNPAILLQTSNNTGEIRYIKMTNMLPMGDYRGVDNVYLIQSRGGEVLILGVGHTDLYTSSQKPLCKRLLNIYSKINGIAYKDDALYIKINILAHEIIVTRLCGNWNNSNLVTTTIVTEDEYNQAIPVTIDS